MKAETVYTVTETGDTVEEHSYTVLATVEFDTALDSAREFPFLPENYKHRYIDVWRDGDIAHTLFFGENGLETAEKAEHSEVDALV